jgi:hypothetical protein
MRKLEGVNKEYSKVIDICKVLKTHATNIIVMDSSEVVIMQATIPGIYNYCILKDDYIPKRLGSLYINISEITPINAKFRKTTTELAIASKDGMHYLVVSNKEAEPYYILIPESETIGNLSDATYSTLLEKDRDSVKLFDDVPDEEFIEISENLLYRMADNELCTIMFDQCPIYLAKPFLGNTKKTEKLMCRIIDNIDTEEGGIITLQFKQKEEIGDIYTYAAFLKVKEK